MHFPSSSQSLSVSWLVRVRFLTFFCLTSSNCVKTKCGLEYILKSSKRKCLEDFGLWPFCSLLPRVGLCFLKSSLRIPDPVIEAQCYLNALGRVTWEGLNCLLASSPISFLLTCFKRLMPSLWHSVTFSLSLSLPSTSLVIFHLRVKWGCALPKLGT